MISEYVRVNIFHIEYLSSVKKMRTHLHQSKKDLFIYFFIPSSRTTINNVWHTANR